MNCLSAKNGRANGQAVTLDTEPILVADRTMVPLRFISEYMGASVAWDGASQTATINR